MKRTTLILSIAFLIVSVCVNATEMDPATLVFANNDVHSVNVRGNMMAGQPSNEIHIQRTLYDADGTMYIVGGFTGVACFVDTTITSNGLNDLFLGKFTTAGARVWITAQGGPNTDILFDLAVGPSGALYAVGSFSLATSLYGHTLASKGASDALILKYDRNGKNLWVWDIAGGDSATIACSITIDAADSIYVGGTFSGTTYVAGQTMLASRGSNDIFVIKLTPRDHFVRAIQYGGRSDDYLLRIAIGTYQVSSNYVLPRSVCIVGVDYIGDPNHWFLWYSENGTQLSQVQSTAR